MFNRKYATNCNWLSNWLSNCASCQIGIRYQTGKLHSHDCWDDSNSFKLFNGLSSSNWSQHVDSLRQVIWASISKFSMGEKRRLRPFVVCLSLLFASLQFWNNVSSLIMTESRKKRHLFSLCEKFLVLLWWFPWWPVTIIQEAEIIRNCSWPW